MHKPFYKQIESYYDGDAEDFDNRYWKNAVLQRIRQDFREEVKRYEFSKILEIGYGTGIDLVHFGTTHPDVKVVGIDISEGMQKTAIKRIQNKELKNVTALKGKVEDMDELFSGEQFDMIYVFFGALNTVEDLDETARILYRFTSGNGILALSFVNKYYIGGVLTEMLKLRFRAAFSRLRPEWGGYSPTRYLPSRCYSSRQIKKAFNGFRLIKIKGYSIIHPAWYHHGLNRILKRFHPILWRADQVLNKTVFCRFGEYALYIFKKPDNVSQ